MRKTLLIFALLIAGMPLFGQQPASTAENPLAKLKDEVKAALQTAGIPFTEEQEKAVILMMEDRRKASEDLFGDLMNFQAGPTRGQDADRLQSAISWMRNEFLSRLKDYLTPPQLAAWERVQTATAPVDRKSTRLNSSHT